MRMVNKSKKGFTLVEMMLSLAIIAIVSGCLYTLVFAIKDSYLNTFNSDDSTDYAMLFARGFENSFLASVQDNTVFAGSKKKITWKIGLNGTEQALLKSVEGGATTPVFTCAQLKVIPSGSSTPVDKWKIYMTFDWNNATKVVTYTVYVVDNYYSPGVVKSAYTSSVYLPHFDNGTIVVSNPALKTNTNGAVYPADQSAYLEFTPT